MPRSRPGRVIGLPRTATRPVVGSSKPAITRNNVDLPQPEAPIRQTNCPGATATSMRASASISPSPTAKRLLTASTARTGSLFSPMMLRAPGEEAVADGHDDAVGDEAGDADDDH